MLKKRKIYSVLLFGILTGMVMSQLHVNATMPTIDEFKQTIQNNPILANLSKVNEGFKPARVEEILTEYELGEVKGAPSYLGSFGPKVIRPLKDFKGKILLIGGERKPPSGGSYDTTSIAEVKGIDAKRLADLEDALKGINNFKFNVFTGAEITTQEDREALKKQLKEHYAPGLQQSEDRYYLSNILEDVGADLIASAIDKHDMSAIPDNYFDIVEYENVNCPVFLFKETWQIMERITKPGGRIIIKTGPLCLRLIPTVVKGTKWEAQVNKEISDNYKEWANKGVNLNLTK